MGPPIPDKLLFAESRESVWGLGFRVSVHGTTIRRLTDPHVGPAYGNYSIFFRAVRLGSRDLVDRTAVDLSGVTMRLIGAEHVDLKP